MGLRAWVLAAISRGYQKLTGPDQRTIRRTLAQRWGAQALARYKRCALCVCVCVCAICLYHPTALGAGRVAVLTCVCFCLSLRS